MILRHIKNGMKGRCDCLSTLIDKFAHILQFINSDGACARRGGATPSSRERAAAGGPPGRVRGPQFNHFYNLFIIIHLLNNFSSLYILLLQQLQHCYTNYNIVTLIKPCYTNYNIVTTITTLLHQLKHCYTNYIIVTQITPVLHLL